MQIAFEPYLAATYDDIQLERLKWIRKIHAQQEANPELSKDERKDHQRWIKATTLLLEFFFGTGKFKGPHTPSILPPELDIYYSMALVKMLEED